MGTGGGSGEEWRGVAAPFESVGGIVCVIAPYMRISVMPQSPFDSSKLSDGSASICRRSAMRDCSVVSSSASAFGSADRNSFRKKSHVGGDEVVTCSDGPAARKSGIREGGRYERKERLLFEMWFRRWFVTQVVGEGAFRSVERQRPGVHQRTPHSLCLSNILRVRVTPPT